MKKHYQFVIIERERDDAIDSYLSTDSRVINAYYDGVNAIIDADLTRRAHLNPQKEYVLAKVINIRRYRKPVIQSDIEIIEV